MNSMNAATQLYKKAFETAEILWTEPQEHAFESRLLESFNAAGFSPSDWKVFKDTVKNSCGVLKHLSTKKLPSETESGRTTS